MSVFICLWYRSKILDPSQYSHIVWKVLTASNFKKIFTGRFVNLRKDKGK